MTIAAVSEYLYGRRDVATHDDDGGLTLRAEPIERHEFGGRSIPSDFFGQDDSEGVDAVLFSNSATISLFNRIAAQRGYGSSGTTFVRIGVAVDPDPDASTPAYFAYIVEPGMPETYADALQLFANPRARHAVSPDALPGVTTHELHVSGLMLTTSVGLSVLRSNTLVCPGGSRGRALAQSYVDAQRQNAAEDGAVYLEY